MHKLKQKSDYSSSPPQKKPKKLLFSLKGYVCILREVFFYFFPQYSVPLKSTLPYEAFSH